MYNVHIHTHKISDLASCEPKLFSLWLEYRTKKKFGVWRSSNRRRTHNGARMIFRTQAEKGFAHIALIHAMHTNGRFSPEGPYYFDVHVYMFSIPSMNISIAPFSI